MAVKIRLMRVGKKKQPSYRVVVADSRSARDGRIIERIGRYAPREDPSVVEIDGDRAVEWLRNGAQPTEQVQKLLESVGVWEQFTAERPQAETVARKKLAAHKAALANRPVEPEEPAAEASTEEAAAAEAPVEPEEPAADEPTEASTEAAEPGDEQEAEG